jgi:pimeloyl-ACP methyl ester carboxylesterase
MGDFDAGDGGVRLRFIVALALLSLVASTGCSTLTAIPDKRLSDVGGYPIEFATAGTGRPVIVFISGGGPSEMDKWGGIYQDAKTLSAVFAYNRFGDGRSASVDEPQTGSRIVSTLHDLLRSAGLTPPYLLVGHSLGGLYADLFARSHPEEVSGVVLVDSTHPDQAAILRGEYQGVVARAFNSAILKLFSLVNPTKYSEIATLEETVEEYKKAGPFPDVPLIVITAGKQPPLSPEGIQKVSGFQRSLAAMSPQGRQVIAERSGHIVQRDQPEIIIQAIHEVVDKIQK